MLGRGAPGRAFDALGLIAERPWWPNLGGAVGEALVRHWRHAVAVSQAARRLARDAGDPEPDRVARAGLLHGLGRWAVAAIDPQWLADWLAEPDPGRRLELERRTLGTEVTTLGRVLAERWGCDPLVVDAAWLHADAGPGAQRLCLRPEAAGPDPGGVRLGRADPLGIGRARSRAIPTPRDPRLRLLIAEVQVRCGSPFVEPDATPHEERLARSNARLRRQLDQLRAVAAVARPLPRGPGPLGADREPRDLGRACRALLVRRAGRHRRARGLDRAEPGRAAARRRHPAPSASASATRRRRATSGRRA